MHNTIHNQDPRHQSNSGAREDPGIPEDYWVSVHLDQPNVHLFKIRAAVTSTHWILISSPMGFIASLEENLPLVLKKI